MSDLPVYSRRETTHQLHVRTLKSDICCCPFCREAREEPLSDYDKRYIKGFRDRGIL